MNGMALILGAAFLAVHSLELAILLYLGKLMQDVLTNLNRTQNTTDTRMRPTANTNPKKHQTKLPEEKALENERMKAEASIAEAGLHGEKLGEYE